jgi:hypothetical protein
LEVDENEVYSETPLDERISSQCIPQFANIEEKLRQQVLS